MGQFNSGYWIIGLSIYYFVFFLLLASVIQVGYEYDTVDTSGVYQTGIEFDATEQKGSLTNLSDVSADSSGNVNVKTLIKTLSFASGIGTSELGIGFPAGFQFIFSFVFFWIPATMLLFAIYMALPVIH